MRRVITAVLFLLIAIALCLTGYAVCLDRLNSINDSLGKAAYVANVKDEDAVNKAATEINKEWDKSSVALCALVNHSDMDEIDNKIAMLSYYAKDNNYYEFEKACQESIAVAEHIIKSQEISFENIF